MSSATVRQALIERGASIEARDIHQETALIIASRRDHSPVVKVRPHEKYGFTISLL